MCLVCEAYAAVDRRFESIGGEDHGVALKYGGTEEELAKVLAFLFYGQDMTQHERDQVWQRALNAGAIFFVAGMQGAGSPIDLVGSAYLIGFAHGQKFREMKENE